MKNYFFTALAMLICGQFAIAQKASDVLENGIQVKYGEKIFLQYGKSGLKFDIAKSLQDAANPPDFTTLDDSTIFLVSKNGVNVYLNPLNPLSYSYVTGTKVITDPINESAATALGSIIDVLSTTSRKVITPGVAPGSPTTVFDTCLNFKSIETNLKAIQELLKANQKDDIIKVFKQLKALTFLEKDSTLSDLEKIKNLKSPIEKHFTKIDSLIKATKKKIEDYKCDKTSGFITQYIFNSILKDLNSTNEEQKKRLDNLQTVYNLVEKAQQIASVGGGENGLRWCIKLDEVPSKEGKISVYTISIKENGYELSDKLEIVSIESKDILKRTFRVRKFQRFVPELSVGVAYTFFTYNTYGTTSDASGQQFVAPPTENSVRNINITTMINLNLYCPNSNIHPLWQIGLGINSEMPTLITGLGVRLNLNSKTRFRITGGLAMTWIKDLETLKVGSKISGTSDIDKDLKYKTSPLLSPYVGLQYNF